MENFVNSHIIANFSDFTRLKIYVDKVKSDFICYDTETDSEIEKKANLFGLGFCLVPSRIFYLVWRDQSGNIIWSKEQQKEIIEYFYILFKNKKGITHNGIYDCLVIKYNWNINIYDTLYHDTVLSAHTLNEEGPFALKELGQRAFGKEAIKEQTELKESVLINGGKWTEKQKDIYKADTSTLAKYCIKDVNLTYSLFERHDKELRDNDLHALFYNDEVMPLYREVTIPMKLTGFHVDVAYFENLKAEIEELLNKLEEEIVEEIKEEVKPFTDALLDKEAPIKAAGNFPKFLAEKLNIPLPINEKTQKVSLAASVLKKQKKATPEYSAFYDWVSGEKEIPVNKELLDKLRTEYFLDKVNSKLEEDESPYKYVFNLNSNKHLAYYFFEVKKYEAKSLTETGQKSVNAAFIEELRATDEKAQKIIDFKKLQKLLSTYVVGILSRQIDGVIYTSMLQHGTTSGRYSSRNPNLQNCPRIKDEDSGLSEIILKYVNAIRKGFVAPEGYSIIGADFSQLEPTCFSEMSASERLKDIFRTGKDLYSQVAIDVNKLEKEYSADKKAANFLKKHRPELRQLWKVPPLGIVYGMEEARLCQSIGCDRKEATKIIRDYLNTYPELKKYMQQCDWSAKKNGFVKNLFGRVRHLPEAKILYAKYGNDLLDWRFAKKHNLLAERRKFKTLLNNAKNFPIQSLAAHIVNRSAIAIAKEFKRLNLQAKIALQIHDELLSTAKNEEAEQVKQIMKQCMENTVKISVPLIAEPIIAKNWADAK